MRNINEKKTSANLRLLAKDIDENLENTDFAFIRIVDGEIKTAYHANSPFELVGALHHLQQKITFREIDE